MWKPAREDFQVGLLESAVGQENLQNTSPYDFSEIFIFWNFDIRKWVEDILKKILNTGK